MRDLRRDNSPSISKTAQEIWDYLTATRILNSQLIYAGPIVRITLDELHVQNSDYWDELYSRNTRADKYEWMAARFGNNGSIFAALSHDLYRTRRGLFNALSAFPLPPPKPLL